MRWEEMDTAPHDGSVILAWREGWTRPSYVQWRLNSRTNTEFWNDPDESDAYELETEPPTHWLHGLVSPIEDRRLYT